VQPFENSIKGNAASINMMKMIIKKKNPISILRYHGNLYAISEVCLTHALSTSILWTRQALVLGFS
jgi:hypothetical protein